MKKFSIEITNDEDTDYNYEVETLLNASKYRLALWDIDQMLRSIHKYDNDEEKHHKSDIAYDIREKIHEILTDYNLDIE